MCPFDKVVRRCHNKNMLAFETHESWESWLIHTAYKPSTIRASMRLVLQGILNRSSVEGKWNFMFASFIGNRFNNSFYNGAALCYHSNSTKEFLNQRILEFLNLVEACAFGFLINLWLVLYGDPLRQETIFRISKNIYFN